MAWRPAELECELLDQVQEGAKEPLSVGGCSDNDARS